MVCAQDPAAISPRRIYVPIEDLDVVLDHDQRGVLLDKAEFDKLTTLAEEETKKRPKSPAVAYAWTKTSYQAAAVDDQLVLTVKAELQQFAAGWQRIIIPLPRISIEQAKLDGEPALIGRGDQGSLILFLAGSGPHVLELQLTTELSAIGADRVAAFGLIPAPTGSLTLTVPAGKRLNVGGWQLPRPKPLEEAAEYKVAVGGQDSLQLRLTEKSSDQAADVLVFATTGYGLHVMPGEVAWSALTTLQVFGKPLDRITISAPNFLEIADIESSGLESWELADDPNKPDHARITLTYRQPFDGERKIHFKGVMATPTDAPWTVPTLVISNVTSQIGQVIVQYPAGVRLQTMDTAGVRRATADTQPASDMPIDMGNLGAVEQWRFDFWQPEFTLKFITQPRQRDVQTAVAAVLDVNATGLNLEAALTVKTRFAPLFEVDLELPAEWVLLSVTRDGNPLTWQTVSQAAGKHLWRIPLSPALAVDQMTTLQLSLHRDVEGWPVENDPLTVDLPELVLPQSDLHEGTLIVRGDEEFELAALDVIGLDSVPLKAAFERLRFQSQDTRYSGNLKVTRKPSRVAVETLSFTRLDPQTVHTFWQAMVDVQGGGVRQLKIELPESAGTALRFLSPGGPRIVEQTSAAGPNGLRVWTLQFDHRVRGRFQILVDIERPRGDAESFTVPEGKFVDAERQNGFIALEASGEQRLTIDPRSDKQEKLTEVDALDLPRTWYVPKERIIAVYRTVLPGAVVTLSEQRFDKEAVPTAICRTLNMTTVAARTGELQHRGEFALKVVGVQSLSLKLPAESRLWATLVDGKPVEVRRGDGVYLVPLPANSQANERKLELFYQSHSDGMEKSGTLEQSPPELTVVTGTGTDQPVVVLEQQWRLYHPDDTLLVDSHGWLEPTTPLDGSSWLGRWQERLRQPTWRELGQSLLYALVAFVMVALPVLAFRRFGAKRLIGFGVGVFLLGVVGILLVPAVMRTGRNARLPSAYYLDDDVQYFPTAKTAAPAMGAAATPPQMNAPMDAASPEPVHHFRADVEHDFAPPKSDAPMAGENAPLAQKEKDALNSLGYAGGKDGEAKSADDAFRPKKARPKAPVVDGFGAVKHGGEAVGGQAKGKDNNDPASDTTVLGRALTEEEDDETRQRIRQQEDRAEKEARESLVDARPSKLSGLLSLSLELTPPAGSRVKDFRYVGQGTGTSGAPLSLSYGHRTRGTTFRMFLIALFALAAWLQRRAPLSWKIAVIVLGVAVPLGLVTIAPQSWQVALDGVFFGALVAAAVWIAEAGCGWCEKHCTWCCGTTVVKAAGLMMAIVWAGEIRAQEDGKAETPAKPKDQNVVVVPYDVEKGALDSERIFLSHEKFLELWKKAHPDEAGPAALDGGLCEALYAAKLDVPADKPEDAVVRVTARYAIQSYVKGQWSVWVPLRSVALASAKLDGKPAILTPKDDSYLALIPTAGRHVLDLEFSVPAKLTGTAGQFTLPLKSVAAGKLNFTLPAKDLIVRVNGSTSAYRKVTKDDVSSIELPADLVGDLTIAWQPPQAKGAGSAVVHVESATGATIGDAGVTVSIGLNYRVRQGTIQDVSFNFPAKLKLQTVTGNDVGGWELQETPEGRKLRVLFRRGVNDQTQLFVTLFLDQRVGGMGEEFDLPTITPLEITNEVGTVAIYAGEQFQVSVGQTTGLNQIDVATFTPAMPVTTSKSPPRAAYRFAKRPFTATFQVGRQSPQGQLTAQHGVTVMRRKFQSTSRFHYQLTGAPRSVLSFTLPKDFLPLEVRATALADWYVDTRGDTPVLTVQLAQTRLGTVEAVITGSRPRDPNSPTAEILLPQPLDVTRMESTLAIWTDESYLASVVSSEGWRAVDANAAGPALQRLRAKQAIRFAFQSSGATVKPVTLQLTRGEAKLRADTLVTTTVTEFTVVHALALQWQIDGAAVDSLTLTTPKSLSGRLDFQGPELREVTEADAGNDRVRWTIWFRTPVSGKYFATALAALPPATDRVAAPAILCEQPVANGQPATIENQRQYVLLINGSTSQLTIADANIVEPVQRDDLPIVVPQQQIDQGTELVRLKQLGTAPAWTMQKFATTESIPASVNFADLTTVVARDGTYRTQAVYTIKNRRRQFLALRLPDGSQLLSVLLQGQPARSVSAMVAGQKAHLVALPKTSEADLSFPVKVVIAGRLPKALPKKASFASDEIEIPSPQVISQADDEAFGIPTARTRWTVYLADDLEANASREPSKHNLTTTPEGAAKIVEAQSAIQELNELLDVWENASNYRQRDVAARNNMKQLGVVMNNYRSYSSDSGISVQQKAEIDEQQRKVVDRFNKLQQEQQSQAPGQPAAKTDGKSQQMLNFNDQSEVLSFSIANNSAVFQGNGSGIQTQTEGTDDLFQLEVQDQTVPQGDTKPNQAQPQSQKSDFQTRGVYQRANEANLGDLNARVAGKNKQAEQQMIQSEGDFAKLVEEYNDLTKQNRHAEAELLAKRMKELQPNNPAAETMFWKSRFSRRDAENRTLRLDKEESFMMQLNEVEKATVVRVQDGSPIRFGDDWSDLASKRNYRVPATGTPIGQPGATHLPGLAGGGMGGMGGGMDADDAFAVEALDAEHGHVILAIGGDSEDEERWTQAGGLSLPFELPVAGQKLVYTKTGGDPKLTLSLRPKAALRFGLGLLWTAVWVIGAFVLAAAVRRPQARTAVAKVAVWGLLLVGLAGWCLLPMPLSGAAFAAMVIGAFGVLWSATKPAVA